MSMKDIMAKSNSMRQAKLKSYGAKGPVKDAADKYGCGGMTKRAFGGRVQKQMGGSIGDVEDSALHDPMDGDAPKPRMDKKPRGNTVININVGKPGQDAAPPPPPPLPPPPMAPPPPPPMAGPPMPPPGMGPPPMGMPPPGMPMRAKGGRVHKQKGGWVGEGDSGKRMKERSAANTEAAEKDAKGAIGDLAQGTMNTALGVTGPKFREMGKLGKTLKGGTLASGLGLLASGAARLSNSYDRTKQAEKDSKAGDEAEGKQMGGPIMGGGMARPMQRKIPPAVAQAIASKKGMGPPMRNMGGGVKLDAGSCSGEGREEKRDWYRSHKGGK